MTGLNEKFPRQVTTVSGNKRWQGSDGLTYDTLEEANGCYAQIPINEEEEVARQTSFELGTKPSWESAATFFCIGAISAWLGFVALRNGFDFSDWGSWFCLIIGISGAGFLLQALRDIFALTTGRSEDYNAEAVLGWWLEKLVFWPAIIVLGVIALVAAWLIGSTVFDGAFDGIDKGTGIVIILLLCILYILADRR